MRDTPTRFAILWLLAMVGASAQAQGLQSTIWRGSYDCAQGPTPATLLIKTSVPDGARQRMAASFHFGGGGLPRGTYLLEGSYDPATGELSMTPTQWVGRPGNYVAVGFQGRVDGGLTTFDGKVDFHLCGAIRLTNQTPDPRERMARFAPAQVASAPNPLPVPRPVPSPPPAATAEPLARAFTASNPPSIEQFRGMTAPEKARYRESVLRMPTDDYARSPLEVKLRIGEIARADAADLQGRATQALADLKAAALRDPGLGADANARLSALNILARRAEQWLRASDSTGASLSDLERDLRADTTLSAPQKTYLHGLAATQSALKEAEQAAADAQAGLDRLMPRPRPHEPR